MIEGLLVRGTGTSEAQALALPQALLAAPWADAGWLHAVDATSPRPQLWSKLAVSARRSTSSFHWLAFAFQLLLAY